MVEAPDLEELPPFDPSTQQSITHLDLIHVKHFLDSNPKAVILDVRPRPDYDTAHLPGAVCFPYDPAVMPFGELLKKYPEFDTKKKYFIYGTEKNYLEIDVSILLSGVGYQYLFKMNEGVESWIKEGLPVMSTATVK